MVWEKKCCGLPKTIVFQTTHVFCSGFRRIGKERSYSAQLSELTFDQECCSRECQMLSLFLRQDTKIKTCGTDRTALIVRVPIQISAATRSAALMPARQVANAVLLQHVKEVLKVSLLSFITVGRESQHCCRSYNVLSKLFEPFLGGYPEASV